MQHAPVWVRQHRLERIAVHADVARDAHCQAGLLENFAVHRGGERFTEFHAAAGQIPVAVVTAALQQDFAVARDEGVDADPQASRLEGHRFFKISGLGGKTGPERSSLETCCVQINVITYIGTNSNSCPMPVVKKATL